MIIGQENCRLQMTQSHFSAIGKTTPPSPAADLPTLTYEKRLTLDFNGEEIEAASITRRAHTDGDTICIASRRCGPYGRCVCEQLYPYIDLSVKGTIDGYFPVIDEVLGKIDDKTQVMPGAWTTGDETS